MASLLLWILVALEMELRISQALGKCPIIEVHPGLLSFSLETGPHWVLQLP